MASRSRCESPAPRDLAADKTPAADQVCKDMQTSTPSLSIVVFLATALLFGRAALLADSQELFGDISIWTALVVFFVIGAMVMRFDFVDIVREEAKQDGHAQPSEPPSLSPPWLVLGCVVALLVAVALGMTAGQYPSPPSGAVARGQGAGTQLAAIDPLVMKELLSRSAKVTEVASLDATMVPGAGNVQGPVLQAAGRCRVKAAELIKCTPAAGASRWQLSVQLTDEVTIFLLSAALAIGLATAISDIAELSQAQQEAATGAVGEFPSPEKEFRKASQARSQWRLLACVVLLIAVAASFVASLMEGM